LLSGHYFLLALLFLLALEDISKAELAYGKALLEELAS
jgi:hypothetical protein